MPDTRLASALPTCPATFIVLRGSSRPPLRFRVRALLESPPARNSTNTDGDVAPVDRRSEAATLRVRSSRAIFNEPRLVTGKSLAVIILCYRSHPVVDYSHPRIGRCCAQHRMRTALIRVYARSISGWTMLSCESEPSTGTTQSGTTYSGRLPRSRQTIVTAGSIRRATGPGCSAAAASRQQSRLWQVRSQASVLPRVQHPSLLPNRGYVRRCISFR